MRARRSFLFLPLVLTALLTSAARSQSVLPRSLPAADLLRLEGTQLSMDLVTRFFLTASDIAALAKKDPHIQAAVDLQPVDLATTAHRVASDPQLLAAVTAHGFTPDSFAVVEFTMLQTVLALGADAKTLPTIHANPANVALFQQHGPEIATLFAKLQQ